MELTYTVSEKDYIQFNLFHYEHSKAMKRFLVIIGILIPLILCAGECILSKEFKFISLLTAIVFVIVWFGFGGKLYRKLLSYSVRMLMKEGKVNEFIGQRTLSLLDDKIRMVDVHRTIETSYSSIQRIEADSERFYIYTGTISAFIVPLSAFQEEAQKRTFIDTIKQRAKL